MTNTKQSPTDNQTDKKPDDKQKTPDELEKLQQKCDEYLNGWKRAKADYLNLKKETEGKQMEMVQFANAALLSQLFPMYENFKLALEHVPEEHGPSAGSGQAEWVTGFTNIKKQFTDFFKNLGIEEIKTVGEKFDPLMHEAVEKKSVEGKEADIVVEEVKTGYKLHGKVLVVAKVVVSE